MKGERIKHSDLTKIQNDLDDLLLPYEIDLAIYDTISNPNLIDHIMRVGKTIYKAS